MHQTDIMNKLGLEETLILKLSKINPTEEDIAICKSKVEQYPFDWTKFISFSFEHKVPIIVFKNCLRHNINIPLSNWYNYLELLYAANTQRNIYTSDKISEIVGSISEKGIKCILLKGIMLNQTTFMDSGLRYSNDIDLLVEEKYLEEVISTFQQYGFMQGVYDFFNDCVVKASRNKIIMQRLSTHEIFPLMRRTENSFCKVMIADVHFDIFSRAKNMRVVSNIDQLFLKAEPNKFQNSENTWYSLCPEHNIIHLSSHIYQDATMIHSIKARKDIQISKYVDLYEYILYSYQKIEWDSFANELLEMKVNSIVYYALYHLELLYGNLVPLNFMNTIKPISLHYLNKYGFEENNAFEWKNTFFDRIFNFERVKEVTDIPPDKLSESTKYDNYM